MKVTMWGAIAGLICCFLSGIIGAYTMAALQESKAKEGTLQLHKLELIDANKKVRAVFLVDEDGGVGLRMFSQRNSPIVELGVDENPGPQKLYAPSGHLTIRDGNGQSAIELFTRGRNEGSLSFLGPNHQERVTVGYSHYGDAIDDHDRGTWGISILGPDHKASGINAFSEDGVIKGFSAPLEAPQPTTK